MNFPKKGFQSLHFCEKVLKIAYAVSRARTRSPPESEFLSAIMSDSSGEDGVLRINSKFASEYEQSKRKEQLSKSTYCLRCCGVRLMPAAEEVKDALLTMRKQAAAGSESGDSSTSEDEDAEGELLTMKLDGKIQKTLEKIRRRDPAIYDPSVKFFEEGDNSPESASEEEAEKPKKKKAKSVKMVLTEQMMAETENSNVGIIQFRKYSR
jgi:hypothetical protein